LAGLLDKAKSGEQKARRTLKKSGKAIDDTLRGAGKAIDSTLNKANKRIRKNITGK
jgi:hypothetical protein